MVNALELLWLIPLFPAAGAALMLFVGRRLPKSVVSIICPGMVFLSFLLSLAAVVQLLGLPERRFEITVLEWLPQYGANWAYLLDPLSSVMILVVSGIGFLIHVYATGYMAHEGGFYRFFGYLNLFVFFMLTLVLANNYTLLFVGWEGVGLCSYLLIGFYFDRKSASDAGIKAFVVNRIGDAAFIIGMFMLFAITGTMAYSGNAKVIAENPGAATVITLLFFIGATGKSAQFPLYVWLPDAMEGPTPVSALIHAATMVTAGVYLTARSSILFEHAPFTSSVVAATGAFTAILAATIALTQNDIKRVLAYSTVSQLGYMFLALGVGAYGVAVFHLYTHAFFKALLFLGAGSVIHGMSGEQDMQKMGALKNKMPITHWTMFIASLAIAGVPGLAGFFSKDEILWETFHSGAMALYAIGIVTALMTAFYMWRLMYLTFYGERRYDDHAAHHLHESPYSMTVPLMLLAVGSALGGYVGIPAFVGEHKGAHETMEYILMGVSALIAFSGIFLASRAYLKKLPEPFYSLSFNKWYVDEIYNFLFVNGLVKGGGTLMSRFDASVVDGGVNGAGWLTRFTATLSVWWDTWIVDGAVRLSGFVVKVFSYPVRLAQTGFVQSYALVILFGAAGVLAYALFR